MEYSFINSKHNDQKRANKNNRLSDPNVEYEDVAIEYFTDLDGNLRCALSGEILEKESFSKEHIIAIAIGGHDIAANIVPSGHGYNTIKNDMYILKYLELQENNDGEKIYNPYRLLKIVNYMLKSINARGMDIETYKKKVLTSNSIDTYLIDIEKSDKDKIYSANVASKIGEVHKIEANFQEIEYEGEGITIYTFISDALNKLKDEGIIPEEYIQSLEDMLDNTKEIDVFKKLDAEVEMRQEIIQIIRDRNIGNEYDIAYIMQRRVSSKEDAEEKIDAILSNISQILGEYGVDKEWASIILENRPEVLIDNELGSITKTIKFYSEQSELDVEFFSELFNYNKLTREYIKIFKKLKAEGVELRNIKQRDKLSTFLKREGKDIERIGIEDFNIYSIINNLRSRTHRTTEEERKELKELGILEEEHIKKLRGEVERREKWDAQHYIEIFKKLKAEGLELRNIKTSDKLSTFLEEKDIERIGINDFNIGQVISGLRNGAPKTTEEEQEELKELGILEEEHIKKLRGEIERREQGKNAEYYIEIFKKLRAEGCELRNIKKGDSLRTFLEREGKNIKSIGINDFNIGKVRDGLRNGNTKATEEEQEELKELGILEEDHIKKLRGEVERREAGKNAKYYIEIFKKLKAEGCELRNIKKADRLSTFLEREEKDIKRIGINDFNIGQVKHSLRNGKPQTTKEEQEELKELGILEEEHIKKLRREIERREAGKNAEYYIEIFKKLRVEGCELRNIKKADRLSTFLIREHKDIERIGIEDFSIGRVRDGLRNGESQTTKEEQEELKELGILEEEHIKKLRGEIERKEKYDAQYYIEIFRKLKAEGCELRNIKQSDRLSTFLKKEDKDIESVGIEDFPIGRVINNLRNGGTQTTKEEREELKELGILTEDHIKNLEEKDKEKAMKLMKKSVAKNVKENKGTRRNMQQQVLSMQQQTTQYVGIGR